MMSPPELRGYCADMWGGPVDGMHVDDEWPPAKVIYITMDWAPDEVALYHCAFRRCDGTFIYRYGGHRS
jgi:hypothetical protein